MGDPRKVQHLKDLDDVFNCGDDDDGMLTDQLRADLDKQKTPQERQSNKRKRRRPESKLTKAKQAHKCRRV